jgi:hypothetical protein
MFDKLLDPVILFFIFGVFAGIFKSDLRVPSSIYEMLSIYLLMAIGLKGGVELAEADLSGFWLPVLGVICLGVLIPLLAYPILRRLGHFKRPDAASIAAHYGAVSIVTFAVVVSFLGNQKVSYEGYMTAFYILLEVPAVITCIFIARIRMSPETIQWRKLFQEVFFGKSIYLLISGLLIGSILGAEGLRPIENVYIGFFKGALAFFLLELGVIASHRLADLRKAGFFLFFFAIGMPILAAAIATLVGLYTGLSLGGTTILATLAASASYITAPSAMRIAIPEANPTLSITPSLGITFPFNIILGIPLYYWMAQIAHTWRR